MPRTKGSPNKFNPAKEAERLTKQMEDLVEGATTPEVNLGLVKAGFSLAVHTLILSAMGDESIKGLSATNRITAAKELKDLGLKAMGDDAFKELEGQAKKEQAEASEEESEDTGESGNVFTLKKYTE